MNRIDLPNSVQDGRTRDKHRADHDYLHTVRNLDIFSADYPDLQTAADIAAADQKMLVISGEHILTSPLVIHSPVSCTWDARLFVNGAEPGVVIGMDDAVLIADIDLPPLRNSNPTFDYRTGARGNDVGVILKAMRNSRISLRGVQNFSTGVHIASSPGREFSYNTLYDWALWHNGIGLYIYPAADAWCNENLMTSGQINMLGGFTRVPNTRFIELAVNDIGGHGPNGWKFDKVSLEGDTPEYQVVLNGALQNAFVDCRWEGQPYIYLTAPEGEYCVENTFRYGCNARAITLVPDVNAVGQVRDNKVIV